MNNTDKPRVKFYSDGSIHKDGVNSINFYETFGFYPLSAGQNRKLIQDFIKEFINDK
jgi:hypothetical protein